MTHPAAPSVMRSKLGQARGLGSAKSGIHHWWAQKVTSFALLPLTLWFIWSCIHLRGAGRAGVAHYMANPLVSALTIALLVTTFHHLQLGLEAVVVDYVREEKRKLATILTIKAICTLFALAGAIAVLKLAITG